MTKARSIAVAQTRPVPGDVGANVDEHLRLVRLAGDEDARIVVFPELSLTGYELSVARDLAFSEDDPRLSPLRGAAASCSATLVVGAPVRLRGRLHIGAFILGADWSVALYTKHRLGAFAQSARCDGVVPPAEATAFEPGDRDPLLRIDGHTAALAICADAGRASHAAQAARRGADAYLASMFVIPSEFERDSAKLGAYASRHAMVVALANFGAPSGGLAAAGRSSIWSRTGELLTRLGASGAGLGVATETAGGWHARSIAAD